MPYAPKPNLPETPLNDGDSYKLGHYKYYPPGTTNMMGYFSARKPAKEYVIFGLPQESTLFQLQYELHRYLAKPITSELVAEAAERAWKHGMPFNLEGWQYIVDEYDGYVPVRIRAIPEGLIVPVGNALMTMESTDPMVPWTEGWLETQLVRCWSGSTVALMSRQSKKLIARHLMATQGNLNGIDFMLHDFGGRGVDVREMSMTASAAHLLSFQGSDSGPGIDMANHYYDCEMSAFSIEASEHSNPCMWGRENEKAFVQHYIDVTLGRGAPIAACIGDTYNIYDFIRMVTTGDIREQILRTGGKFVARPDSGDPLKVLPKILGILDETLKNDITIRNGYKVLPPWFGLIQGDGINMRSMNDILQMYMNLGWCVSNFAFGSGGGLLQWLRDDLSHAFKLCWGVVDGEERNVHKDPITDSGKRSLAGRLDLIRHSDGRYETVTIPRDAISHPQSVMNTVWEIGPGMKWGDQGGILYNNTLGECRERMAVSL